MLEREAAKCTEKLAAARLEVKKLTGQQAVGKAKVSAKKAARRGETMASLREERERRAMAVGDNPIEGNTSCQGMHMSREESNHSKAKPIYSRRGPIHIWTQEWTCPDCGWVQSAPLSLSLCASMVLLWCFCDISLSTSLSHPTLALMTPL